MVFCECGHRWDARSSIGTCLKCGRSALAHHEPWGAAPSGAGGGGCGAAPDAAAADARGRDEEELEDAFADGEIEGEDGDQAPPGDRARLLEALASGLDPASADRIRAIVAEAAPQSRGGEEDDDAPERLLKLTTARRKAKQQLDRLEQRYADLTTELESIDEEIAEVKATVGRFDAKIAEARASLAAPPGDDD